MTLRRVAIIYKPNLGPASLARVTAVKQRFELHGIDTVMMPTTPEPFSAGRLAMASLKADPDLVVVVGGDGTANQVATALMPTGVPMSIFAGGTGNLFFRSYSAYLTPQRFVENMIEGNPQPIDLLGIQWTPDGKDQPMHQLSMVGLGFGCLSDAISNADPKWKHRLGTGAYALNMIGESLRPNHDEFVLSMNGKQRTERLSAAFILNVAPPHLALMSRGCNASDGLMDVVSLRGTTFLQLLKTTACWAAGRPERSGYYQRYRVPEVTITSARPTVLNIDGDPGPTVRSFTVRVLPAAVQMVVA